MKVLLTVIILGIHWLNMNAQDKCSCQAMIDWKYSGYVRLYDKPNGKLLDSISNDTTNEDFLILTIFDVKNGFFNVLVQRTIAETAKRGWIRIENYIGTYARNYDEEEITLKLYSLPDKNSGVSSTVNQYISDLYSIIDCNGNWVMVKLTHDGKVYSGWLEKEMQCANPYTNCN